jgi:hypothetical protein
MNRGHDRDPPGFLGARDRPAAASRRRSATRASMGAPRRFHHAESSSTRRERSPTIARRASTASIGSIRVASARESRGATSASGRRVVRKAMPRSCIRRFPFSPATSAA